MIVCPDQHNHPEIGSSLLEESHRIRKDVEDHSIVHGRHRKSKQK